jgi:hypothetical protein
MHQIHSAHGYAYYADASFAPGVLDLHAAHANKSLILSASGVDVRDESAQKLVGGVAQLDFTTWLPAAAKQYIISPNPDDYILTPVLTIPSDLPNRNCVGFPLKELLKFNVDQGRLAYKTFIGKPVHLEHDNEDPLKALGVIVDAVLKPTAGFGMGRMWRLFKLLAIDRTKNPEIARKILAGELNTYSMGAWVKDFNCSYCYASIGKCRHLHPQKPRDFYEMDGKLVYRLCAEITGFETSVVFDPAYSVAASDVLFGLQ